MAQLTNILMTGKIIGDKRGHGYNNNDAITLNEKIVLIKVVVSYQILIEKSNYVDRKTKDNHKEKRYSDKLIIK